LSYQLDAEASLHFASKILTLPQYFDLPYEMADGYGVCHLP